MHCSSIVSLFSLLPVLLCNFIPYSYFIINVTICEILSHQLSFWKKIITTYPIFLSWNFSCHNLLQWRILHKSPRPKTQWNWPPSSWWVRCDKKNLILQVNAVSSTVLVYLLFYFRMITNFIVECPGNTVWQTRYPMIVPGWLGWTATANSEITRQTMQLVRTKIFCVPELSLIAGLLCVYLSKSINDDHTFLNKKYKYTNLKFKMKITCYFQILS